jgi:hypothetical protein
MDLVTSKSLGVLKSWKNTLDESGLTNDALISSHFIFICITFPSALCLAKQSHCLQKIFTTAVIDNTFETNDTLNTYYLEEK